MRYAVVTPARNEVANLPRLARCLEAQTAPPTEWIVADTGSSDETPGLAAVLGARLVAAPAGGERGGPIVRGFLAGVDVVAGEPDVVVKLDADLSFAADYFERLLATFAADPSLGIASGSCWEEDGGEWRQRFGTNDGVWGACRAYRLPCLHDVSPLEERQGWDEIDAIKARARGWSTRTILDLPFRHHRVEGLRDGSRRRVWRAQGDAAHYMGYRPSYLVLRAAFRARREPAALAMIGGYASAAMRRTPRCSDAAVRAEIRRAQSVRRLPVRAREALGIG